jgi:hypothetical protein
MHGGAVVHYGQRIRPVLHQRGQRARELPRDPAARVITPGGCQIGYMCDQNSTYGLRSLPGGVRLVTGNVLAVIN